MPKKTLESPYLTPNEIKDYLKISKAKVYQLFRQWHHDKTVIVKVYGSNIRAEAKSFYEWDKSQVPNWTEGI